MEGQIMKTLNKKHFDFKTFFNKKRLVESNIKNEVVPNFGNNHQPIAGIDNNSNVEGLLEQNEYRIVSARHLLENDITEIPMLWGHLLQKCGIAVLSGSSDTGKSTLLRQLAIAIVIKEEKFLGIPLNLTHNRVIYISTEDDEYSLSPRIKKEHRNDSPANSYDNLTFILDGEDPFEAAKKEYKRMPADCIIIDTWGDYADGDLNSANNVRTPLKALRSFALANNCLFIISHHNRKSASDTDTSKKNLLGSQSLEAKARVVIMLTIDNDDTSIRKLSVSKGNYIPYELKRKSIVLRANENFVFEYLTEVENHVSKGTEVDKRRTENEEAVKMLLGQGKKPTEIIAELPSMLDDPYKKSAVRDIIKKLSNKDEESKSTLL